MACFANWQNHYSKPDAEAVVRQQPSRMVVVNGLRKEGHDVRIVVAFGIRFT
jgi:hypothetical protein